MAAEAGIASPQVVRGGLDRVLASEFGFFVLGLWTRTAHKSYVAPRTRILNVKWITTCLEWWGSTRPQLITGAGGWMLITTWLVALLGTGPVEAKEPTSTDTSRVVYSGTAWFDISFFDVASLTIYVENQLPGHFLRFVEIECKLMLKNGKRAQTDKYRVYFANAIPPGGASQGKVQVDSNDLRYHIDDYSQGPRQDACRLVGAESIEREIKTDPFVSVTAIECGGLFGSVRYRLKNTNSTRTVKSATTRCWKSRGVGLALEGFWSESGPLRRPMAPKYELLGPGAEEWLDAKESKCVDSDPIICSVDADFR